MRISVWAEGHVATGSSSDATLLGTYEADNFDAAVEQWKSKNPEDAKRYLVHHPDGTWTYWACRLFDSENEARKAFG